MLTAEQLAKVTPYLAIINGIHGGKVYSTIGAARGAISHKAYGRGLARGAQLYRHGPSGWEIMHDIAAGTAVSNMPWKKDKNV